MVTTAIVLGSFLGVTGWVLDRSFAASVLMSAEQQMRLVVYALLSTAEEHDDHLEFFELEDPRLLRPDSGLYAYIEAADGALAWRSPSMEVTAVAMPSTPRPVPGSFGFLEVQDPTDASQNRFQLGYTVIWDDAEESEFTFWVLEDQLRFRAEIRGFRQNVTIGLVSATLLLLVVQLVALRWGLRPVRLMTDRIRALEVGDRHDIGRDYPRELSGLARTMNLFIEHEQASRERYRRAMGDLAHSLKTPLAVLKNATRGLGPSEAELFEEQLDRMETTVTHQLSRATAVRPVIPLDLVEVVPLLERLTRALDKAYAEKNVDVEIEAGQTRVRADARDLLEMFGNLLENAYKYTRTKVRVATQDGDTVRVIVDDDGAGIPADVRQRVLERGERAETAQPGHGIGLAVVVELVAAYDGRLEITDSDFGGARVILEIPR